LLNLEWHRAASLAEQVAGIARCWSWSEKYENDGRRRPVMMVPQDSVTMLRTDRPKGVVGAARSTDNPPCRLAHQCTAPSSAQLAHDANPDRDSACP
jgi:hypothetical protein